MIVAESAVQGEFSPLTVYVVFSVGETAMVEVCAPVLHEYLFAPVTLSTVACPTQRLTEDEEGTSVGVVFTVTVVIARPVQVLVAPQTVYVVVAPGVTPVNDAVAPVDQL